MGIETERKFLVNGEFKNHAVKELNIIQSYLSNDPDKTIRLRLSENRAFLTVKSRIPGKSIAKNEWEIEIPYNYASEMMYLCLPGKIVKTRYLVPYGNHTFEVDVFHDKNEGLIIAEIELSAEDEKFDRPDWLGLEVTGRPEYYNANLIK